MPPVSHWPARRFGIAAILAFALVWGFVLGQPLAQISKATSGANRKGEYKIQQFYSIKLTNLTTANQNISFTFTSSKVVIRTPSGNSDEICVDWLQSAAAACPAANTSGTTRIPAGTAITFDAFPSTGIAAIAASGTQTVYVDAYN